MLLYVYLHLDPRTNDVRYVGVGPKSRGYDWKARSAAHLAWIAELYELDLEPIVSFPGRTRDRSEAFEIEKQLISWHRKRGTALFNVTDGGLGAKGNTRSPEYRKHMSDVHTAKWLFDPEFRARRLPDIVKAQSMKNRSAKHRAKITKHAQINGSPCKKCGNTLRYKTSHNCVNCAKKSEVY